jgi:molecular chaperone GrpE
MSDMTEQTVEETSGAGAAPEGSAPKTSEAIAANDERASGEAVQGKTAKDPAESGETAGRQTPKDAGASREGGAGNGGGVVASDGDVADIEGDLDELVKTVAERDEYLALAQRTQADFENYRKRVGRESAAAQERGVIALAKELLPALDNLDRALEDAGTDAEGGRTPDGAGGTAGDPSVQAVRPSGQGVVGCEEEPLLAGVRLVRSELSAALTRVGIESFSPVGETFDPELHEAVATTQQAAGDAKSGTVVEVYQPGYRLGASVIRPARVVVAA